MIRTSDTSSENDTRNNNNKDVKVGTNRNSQMKHRFTLNNIIIESTQTKSRLSRNKVTYIIDNSAESKIKRKHSSNFNTNTNTMMYETPQLRSNRESIDTDILEHEFEQLNKQNESIFHESIKGAPSVSNTNKNEYPKRKNNSESNHNPCFKLLLNQPCCLLEVTEDLVPRLANKNLAMHRTSLKEYQNRVKFKIAMNK